MDARLAAGAVVLVAVLLLALLLCILLPRRARGEGTASGSAVSLQAMAALSAVRGAAAPGPVDGQLPCHGSEILPSPDAPSDKSPCLNADPCVGYVAAKDGTYHNCGISQDDLCQPSSSSCLLPMFTPPPPGPPRPTPSFPACGGGKEGSCSSALAVDCESTYELLPDGSSLASPCELSSDFCHGKNQSSAGDQHPTKCEDVLVADGLLCNDSFVVGDDGWGTECTALDSDSTSMPKCTGTLSTDAHKCVDVGRPECARGVYVARNDDIGGFTQCARWDGAKCVAAEASSGKCDPSAKAKCEGKKSTDAHTCEEMGLSECVEKGYVQRNDAVGGYTQCHLEAGSCVGANPCEGVPDTKQCTSLDPAVWCVPPERTPMPVCSGTLRSRKQHCNDMVGPGCISQYVQRPDGAFTQCRTDVATELCKDAHVCKPMPSPTPGSDRLAGGAGSPICMPARDSTCTPRRESRPATQPDNWTIDSPAVSNTKIIAPGNIEKARLAWETLWDFMGKTLQSKVAEKLPMYIGHVMEPNTGGECGITFKCYGEKSADAHTCEEMSQFECIKRGYVERNDDVGGYTQCKVDLENGSCVAANPCDGGCAIGGGEGTTKLPCTAGPGCFCMQWGNLEAYDSGVHLLNYLEHGTDMTFRTSWGIPTASAAPSDNAALKMRLEKRNYDKWSGDGIGINFNLKIHIKRIRAPSPSDCFDGAWPLWILPLVAIFPAQMEALEFVPIESDGLTLYLTGNMYTPPIDIECPDFKPQFQKYKSMRPDGCSSGIQSDPDLPGPKFSCTLLPIDLRECRFENLILEKYDGHFSNFEIDALIGLAQNTDQLLIGNAITKFLTKKISKLPDKQAFTPSVPLELPCILFDSELRKEFIPNCLPNGGSCMRDTTCGDGDCPDLYGCNLKLNDSLDSPDDPDRFQVGGDQSTACCAAGNLGCMEDGTDGKYVCLPEAWRGKAGDTKRCPFPQQWGRHPTEDGSYDVCHAGKVLVGGACCPSDAPVLCGSTECCGANQYCLKGGGCADRPAAA